MIFFVFSKLSEVLKSYKNKSLNHAHHLAGKSLIEFMSFRLPDSSKADRSLHIRVLKNVFSRIFVLENKVIYNSNNSGLAIVDNSFGYVDLRNAYVENLTGKKIEIHFSKDNLLFADSFYVKCKLAFAASFVFFKYYFKFSKSNKQRVNYALLIREMPEIINLINLLKSKKINTLIDFANYEVDSNFLYLLLKENNITVYKVPSPGPLFIHNSIILTDVLVLSSGYHLEELDTLKHTLVYEKVLKSIPEMSPLFISHYLNNEKNNIIADEDKYTIGFYSHASWLRAISNHADNGMNLLDAENNLLELIKLVLQKNPQYKLTIFLHPRERASAIYNDTLAFYNSKLEGVNYEFSAAGNKSTEVFNKCNIAVVALSTILFERLMMGFKTLIYSDRKNGFPNNTSYLNNITFKNSDELDQLLLANLEVSKSDFFSQNKIDSYLLNNFNTSGRN